MSLFEGSEVMKLLDRAISISSDDIFIKVYSQDRVKKFIAKLNVDQMDVEFVNSEGVQLSDVGGDYSPVTIELSIERGRPKKGIDKVDLHGTKESGGDSGEFHKSIHVSHVDATGFIIDADPIKDDGTNLFTEWGEEILGLTFDSLEKLILFVTPLYQQAINNFLFGK